MESQQMIELLLARLDENAKTNQQEMLAMREEMKQEIRAGQEKNTIFIINIVDALHRLFRKKPLLVSTTIMLPNS
jgi:hypothetical protein